MAPSLIARSSKRLPSGLQPRVRALFAGWALVFCGVNALSLLGQPTPGPLRLLGAASVAHFVVSIVWTERRHGRPLPTDLPLDALALVGFTLALGDPMQILGIVYAVLLYRSQFGPWWRMAAAVPVFSAAYLVGIALAPAPHHPGLHWYDGTVLSMLPGLLVVGILMRLLAVILAQADRSAARERIVARAGEALLRAGSVEELLPPAVAALDGLLGTAVKPLDVGCLVALTEGDLLEVRAVAGRADGALAGGVLPGGTLQALDGSAARVAAPSELAAAVVRLHPGDDAWQVVPLEAHGQLHGCLLLRGGAGLPRELDTTLVTLATQLALAVAGRRAEQELARRAWNDGLTALPNRGLFTRALDEARERHAVAPERLAVLFVDLDDFKTVNDTLGHEAGDELLVQVSDRLRQSLRPQDLAARLGGDEFAVILDGVDDAESALVVGQRLVEALRRPFQLTADTVRIGASVGIALGNAGLDTAETVRCADVAMYTAKAQGKGRVLLFDHVTGTSVEGSRGGASTSLPGGLDVRYRPRVDLGAELATTSEVCLTWAHPQRGPLAGRDALAQAQAEGYGPAVTAWLLETTCRQALAWRREFGPRAPGVSALVTAEQLAAHDVVDVVADVLTRTGAPAGLLTVQVPTDAVMQSAASDAVVGLAGLGVHVAAETDGSAARSLALAQALPVDELLIDVRRLASRAGDLEFVRALCVVAGRTGLTPVAVGVDDGATAALLADLGVTVAQGDAVAPAVPGDRMAQWLDRTAESHAALGRSLS